MRLKHCEFKTSNSIDMDKMYNYMLQVQEDVRKIWVSGIKGIQTVKTGKRVILNPNIK
jgi:hypothetical protein